VLLFALFRALFCAKEGEQVRRNAQQLMYVHSTDSTSDGVDAQLQSRSQDPQTLTGTETSAFTE
jgi:hypothetical protein